MDVDVDDDVLVEVVEELVEDDELLVDDVVGTTVVEDELVVGAAVLVVGAAVLVVVEAIPPQLPAVQATPTAQVLPHVPQFAGSFWRSAQAPLQTEHTGVQ
jgi:hypothetical protein